MNLGDLDGSMAGGCRGAQRGHACCRCTARAGGQAGGQAVQSVSQPAPATSPPPPVTQDALASWFIDPLASTLPPTQLVPRLASPHNTHTQPLAASRPRPLVHLPQWAEGSVAMHRKPERRFSLFLAEISVLSRSRVSEGADSARETARARGTSQHPMSYTHTAPSFGT